MDELRWILLVVGLLILAGIYFFADPSQRTSGDSRISQDEDENGPDGAVDSNKIQDSDLNDAHMERELGRLGALISRDRNANAESAEAAINSEPDRIVSLFLRPIGDGQINGADIVEAAHNAGLVFGDMHIFHRMQEHQGSKTTIFSLADMMTPGSFEMSKISELSTPGLCLFLTLPNQMSALDAWDAMRATGQRLADLLDSELLDDSQSSLSHQCIAHIRDEMREYDRQAATGRQPTADG